MGIGGRIGPIAVALITVLSAMYMGVFDILDDDLRLRSSLTIVSVQPVSVLYVNASVDPELG